MLITPVVRLADIVGHLAESTVSVERIAELLAEERKIRSRSGSRSMGRVQGHVEFRNVCWCDRRLTTDNGHRSCLPEARVTRTR